MVSLRMLLLELTPPPQELFYCKTPQKSAGLLFCVAECAISHVVPRADIMALRCKGLNCDILNFPSEHYDDLAPFLEKLSSVSYKPTQQGPRNRLEFLPYPS